MKILNALLITLALTACSKDDEQPVENKPPGAFSVSARPSGNTVKLIWTKSEDPDGDPVSYSVELGNKTVLSNSTATEFAVKDLDFDTSYSGKVIATDSEGLSAQQEFNFTTGDTPNSSPKAFELIFPVGKKVTVLPELSWESSTDPDGDTVTYDLYLDTEADPVAAVQTGIDGTSFTLDSELKYNTEYFWKVVATDGKGGQTQSVVSSFTTIPNQAPESFVLVDVLNNATNVSFNPSFRWESATDPEGGEIVYDLYLDTNSNLTTVVAENHTNNSITPSSELEANTVYYWKVIAKDDHGNETSSPIWSFSTKNLFTVVNAVQNADFGVRHGHSSVEFNDKIWVIGGVAGGNVTYNDIWQSSNGVNWTKVEPVGEIFKIRTDHSCLIYDNKMWIIGGRWGTNSYNDVWYTEDGISWTEATENADFDARYAQASTVYAGKMWIFGGRSNTQAFPKEAWSSTDGVNWTMQSTIIASSFKADAQVVTFDDKMWKLGGQDEGSEDVFYSTNGTNWVLAKANAPFGNRSKHNAVVHDNKIWLMGGIKDENSNAKFDDVWYSKDGNNWIKSTGSAGFIARANASSIVYDNKIWIIAGTAGFNNTAQNDVWYLDFEQ